MAMTNDKIQHYSTLSQIQFSCAVLDDLVVCYCIVNLDSSYYIIVWYHNISAIIA